MYVNLFNLQFPSVQTFNINCFLHAPFQNLPNIMTREKQVDKVKICDEPDSSHILKAMVFPVITYGCENWTIKKAEYQRIDAFELQHWRKLLRAPWAARRSNQSLLKEISPEYSLKGLILKLKPQYFDHLMRKTDSFVKTLMLGQIEAGEEQDNRG